MAKVQGDFLRRKYAELVQKYNRLAVLLKRNNAVFKRLQRNYIILKRRFIMSMRHADQEKRAILFRSVTEKYTVILDHRRRLVFVAETFLDDIGYTREEFASSFYIDQLFEKFLPKDYTRKGSVELPSFHFPIMLKHYSTGEGELIHPFVHLSMTGKREYDERKKLFLIYLESKDISSDVELDYFQKTDKLIRSLTSTNLELETAKKTIEMHKLMLISMVCSLIEEYNKETSEHLQNIRLLTGFLTEECQRLGLMKKAPYNVNEYRKDINYTSVLHDIGKMGVPRALLVKKGKLTPEEYREIQRHPLLGASYIRRMIDMFRSDPLFSGYEGFLKIPYDICLHHHERWDGKGYPSGLAGEEIPLAARVVALADSYEAMRAKRSYNEPKTHSQCVADIKSESGKQFDPRIVRAFLNVADKFAELSYPR